MHHIHHEYLGPVTLERVQRTDSGNSRISYTIKTGVWVYLEQFLPYNPNFFILLYHRSRLQTHTLVVTSLTGDPLSLRLTVGGLELIGGVGWGLSL